MGCSGSKATDNKVALNDQQKERILSIARTILDESAQFKATIETLQPLGHHRTPQLMLEDSKAVSSYFPNGNIPLQLGEGKFNIANMLVSMKVLCQDRCENDLMAEITRAEPQMDESKRVRYGKIVAFEAEKAMRSVAFQYTQQVFKTGSGGAPVVPSNASRASMAPNATNNSSNLRQSVAPAHGPGRQGSQSVPNNSVPSNVVLPEGNWVLADGGPFYWSDKEKLFYHPESAQFYDPETGKWYDPETDEWYDDDGTN